MFERFSHEARQAVALAEEEARRLCHGWIGTEHLLLGVLAAGGDGASLLAGFGVELDGVRGDVVRIVGRGEHDIDPQALATLGIDLDTVRERVERSFGPGALSRRGRPGRFGGLRFTARAKRALEQSLREGVALGAKSLTGEHLLLGLLREPDGIAAEILTARGVALEAARARMSGREAA